jgi:hypothetical protein
MIKSGAVDVGTQLCSLAVHLQHIVLEAMAVVGLIPTVWGEAAIKPTSCVCNFTQL